MELNLLMAQMEHSPPSYMQQVIWIFVHENQLATNKMFSSIFFRVLGYKYSYPFLSVDCGIHVDDNFVQPLYKQIFNINHPTMAFIGLTKSAINFHLFDLQVNLSTNFKPPSFKVKQLLN